MTNAHQTSPERSKNVPFWRLRCLFRHLQPLLNPARKTHFPCFLGHPGPPPPAVLVPGQNAFFGGLQNHVFMTLARKWGAPSRAPKCMSQQLKRRAFAVHLIDSKLHRIHMLQTTGVVEVYRSPKRLQPSVVPIAEGGRPRPLLESGPVLPGGSSGLRATLGWLVPSRFSPSRPCPRP